MRIAWYSNSPKISSGYGTQTDLITRHLVEAGHEVAILCSHGNRDPLHYDAARRVIYPCGMAQDSQDTIGPYSRHFEAAITILFLDAWIHKPQMWGPLKPAADGIRPVLMFPVDHEPLIRTIEGPARKAWANITYSQHGQRVVAEAGIASDYIPHAVDTQTYYPMEREEARARVGVPKEAFIVGVVAANNDTSPTRKNWENLIEGFRLFKKQVPEALLYLHTEMAGLYDIAGHLEDVGMDGPDTVACTDATAQRLGLIGPEEMRSIYNSFDVLLAPSRGEGFGLPLLEAQACGTPVITGDWTATGELCFSGILIPREKAIGQKLTEATTGSELFRWTAPAGVIAEALQAVYCADQATRESFRINAVKGAAEYDIRRVINDFWLPTLAGYEQRIAAESAA